MNKRDRKALGEYVRTIADAMELRDWHIDLMHDPCEDEALASISATYGRKRASISFNRSFRDLAPDVQRRTVAHELVHLHLEPACDIVKADLVELLGRPADTVLWLGFKRQIEYGVDALSDAVAKHLPLIEWPDR